MGTAKLQCYEPPAYLPFSQPLLDRATCMSLQHLS